MQSARTEVAIKMASAVSRLLLLMMVVVVLMMTLGLAGQAIASDHHRYTQRKTSSGMIDSCCSDTVE